MRYLQAASVFAAVGLAISSAGAADTTIVLDGNGPGKVYEGIGALSAGASSPASLRLQGAVSQPDPLITCSSRDMARRCKHLKVEIGADVNSTDGSEPSSMRSRDDHDYNPRL